MLDNDFVQKIKRLGRILLIWGVARFSFLLKRNAV